MLFICSSQCFNAIFNLPPDVPQLVRTNGLKYISNFLPELCNATYLGIVDSFLCKTPKRKVHGSDVMGKHPDNNLILRRKLHFYHSDYSQFRTQVTTINM